MNNQSLTPRQVVSELDKYIVGQKEAKNLLLLPCATVIGVVSCRMISGMKLCLKIF